MQDKAKGRREQDGAGWGLEEKELHRVKKGSERWGGNIAGDFLPCFPHQIPVDKQYPLQSTEVLW